MESLAATVSQACEAMGFRYFSLMHHCANGVEKGLRLHNYPEDWERWFDDHDLGRLDPIHRASHVTTTGFNWSSVPRLITLTSGDWVVLEQARRSGIGEGYTVPAHVPGEFSGTCSFAVRTDERFPEEHQRVAQLIGGIAFEGARHLFQPERLPRVNQRAVTDRQRECVLWAARGKTNWEISIILGISEQTVAKHMGFARERYGVQRRSLLAVCALFEGLICFSDIFRH